MIKKFDDKQLKEAGDIITRMIDGESKNINPLKEISNPQMILYGFRGLFNSVFFDTEKELEEYVKNNDTSFGSTCTVEYLGNVAGRSDVVRITSKGQKSALYTAIDMDGYGIYNEERSFYEGQYVWEYEYGNLRNIYDAFRSKGIIFTNDVYKKIDDLLTDSEENTDKVISRARILPEQNKN